MPSISDPRPQAFGAARPRRRSRTWNDGGLQYTQQESSYNTPNAAFFSFSQTTGTPFGDSQPARPSPSRGRSSMLGTLVGGLANYVASNAQRPAATAGHSQSGGSRRGRGNGRPKSLLSRVAATLTDPQPRQQSSEQHRRHHSRSQHEPIRDRRSSNAQPAFVEAYSSDESDISDSEDSPLDVIETLRNAADHHAREARHYRRKLEQTRQQGMGQSHVQRLLRKIEEQEAAEGTALRNLQQARAEAEKMSRNPRDSSYRQPRAEDSIFDEFDDDSTFNDPFINDPFFSDPFGGSHQQHRRNARHANANFGGSGFSMFDTLFEEMQHMHSMHENVRQRTFNIPGGTFTASFGTQPRPHRASTTSGHGFQQPQPPVCTAPQPRPVAPPATLLKPEEAKRIFSTYSARWAAVSAVDPNVPFPARGLKPGSLDSRNTLWAPMVSSPIKTWSEETVRKANAQAFFLGAVGMKPVYSEAGVKVVLGIDMSSGSSDQIQQLISILKKERVRWHSDRLGKRNGGKPGANEALQNDERARAVYHGVCELIEVAQ